MYPPREQSWDIPADPQAVGKGRELVRDTLTAWGLDGILTEILVLITSELCTNAIVYGEPPITLAIRQAGACVGGEVADHGRWRVPKQRSSPDDDSDEHGRGLLIIASLVDEWGIESPGGHPGTAVWFRLCSD